MKNIVTSVFLFLFLALAAFAKEEPSPSFILIYTDSSHGYKYAHGGMHDKREMKIKVEHGAQLDIISRGKSGAWIAEARDSKAKVTISIKVYDKGKIIASAKAEGKKLVATIANDKPIVICLDKKKD